MLAGPIPKPKTVFDDKKVTDHHAIIPTDIVPSNNLSPEEKRVYDLVARRFIAVFYPECKVASTTVMGQVGQVAFKATGKQVLEAGWREVYANDAKAKKDKEEGEDPERIMPVFEVGEKGPHEPWIHQGKTTPPKPFTEASLLRAMETAGKQVEDEEMRDLAAVADPALTGLRPSVRLCFASIGRKVRAFSYPPRCARPQGPH